MTIVQVEGVGAPMFISSVPQHDQIKKRLLDAIESMGKISIQDRRQRLTNTDWLLPTNRARPYMPIVRPVFEEHFHKLIGTEYPVAPDTTISQSNYWFQQYGYGDYHDWHHHGITMFSNIYYLELPEKASRTSFFTGGKEMFVDVEEGCILSFPSTLIHRSKPNMGGQKTVIVANVSFDRM